MRYEARVTAYDLLGEVAIAAVVSATDDLPPHQRKTVLTSTTLVRGVGENDPREWLRDALVATLESL